MIDNIFLDNKYIDLYLKNNEEIFSFSYSEDNLFFKNIAIKSPIKDTPYWDLSSPYGYAGYFTNSTDSSFLKRALTQQAQEALRCNIIAEFIRFHPLYCNAQVFAPFLDFFSQERLVIEVDMDTTKRWQNYGSKERNKMRKALRDFEVKPSIDIESFYNLYCETMDKRKAKNFYYFSLDYFKKILALDNSIMLEAKKDNQLHSMSIFLFDSLVSYYHLTANSTSNISIQSGATRSILETFFQFAEKKNIRSCILGGGTTSSEQDSLFLFKKQFSPIIKPFFIGGKIYNYDIFNALKNKSANSEIFLSYRV